MSDPILEQNKATIRRSIEELWNKRNFSIIDELWAEDWVSRSDPPGSPTAHREGWKSWLTETWPTVPPDFRIAINDQIAEGDQVLTRWTMQMTHTTPFMGIPPTGKNWEWHGMSLHHLKDGRIVEDWAYSDFADVVQALRAELQQP